MRSSTNVVATALFGACLLGLFVVAFLLGMPGASTTADEGEVVDFKPVVLVPPFENESKIHDQISFEVDAGTEDGRPKPAYMVDRLTQAPRSVLEDLLGDIDGITVVERKRVDAFLAETGDMRALVDQEKAVKLGKLLGANVILMGTIIDIRNEKRRFKGYGIASEMMDVRCQIRVRILDIETGTVGFSKIVKGTKTYKASSYGSTNSSDRNFAAVEAALERLKDDSQFKSALFRKKADPAAADGLVEVEFAPKPDNCDIDIDGKYVGGSPLKRRLPSGKEAKVRIAKRGYDEWKGVIVPEDGLKITPELQSKR